MVKNLEKNNNKKYLIRYRSKCVEQKSLITNQFTLKFKLKTLQNWKY